MVETGTALRRSPDGGLRLERHPPPGLAAHGSLATLDLAGVVACSAALRREVAGAASLEDAAARVARHLHAGFGNAERTDSVLTRVFATARADELGPDLRALVPSATDDQPCLVLLATAGDEPAWCDRRTSRAHRVLPLTGAPGADPLDDAPMIRALFDQFGISPLDVGATDGRLTLTDVGVFHVPTALGSDLVPAQDFVVSAGVASVVGFGCVLADGRVVAVLQFSRVPVPARCRELFRTLAVSLHLALVPATGRPLLAEGGPAGQVPVQPAPEQQRWAEVASRRGLEQLVEVLGETIREQAEQLRAESALIEELRRLGAELACELDLDQLVDLVVRSAVSTTGAAEGVCSYDRTDAEGVTRRATRSSGPEPAWTVGLEAPSRSGSFLGPALRGESVVRAADLWADPLGSTAPAGHLGVRSCLAAPIVSRCGTVLGTLVLGHPSPDVFDARAEALLVGIAGHAALGMDNARLFTQQREVAGELQRSLLPDRLPTRPGLVFDARYRPGQSGADVRVGGDWYDVLALPQDCTAVVIGDVMGRGLRAAAAMGQLRTALRVLLAGGFDPGAALVEVDAFIGHLPDERIATCAVGVHDPRTQTLRLWSAGHLPALLLPPGGAPVLVGGEPSGPLGALGAPPRPLDVPFPPGSVLLLFTDGLVERRSDGLDTGLGRLVTSAERFPALDLDDLLEDMLHGVQDDDTALLRVQAVAEGRNGS